MEDEDVARERERVSHSYNEDGLLVDGLTKVVVQNVFPIQPPYK